MSVLYPLLAAWLFGCGIYMILSRSIARIVMGLSLIGTSINLMIFQTGRIGPMQPPIIPDGADHLTNSADPVPQALILTAIVIGFALTVMLAALSLRVWQGHGTLSSSGIKSAESVGDPFSAEVGHDN